MRAGKDGGRKPSELGNYRDKRKLESSPGTGYRRIRRCARNLTGG